MLPVRLEPNTKGMKDYLSRIEEHAKKNPKEQILALVFCAGHGYCVDGLQCLAGNSYNAQNNFNELV